MIRPEVEALAALGPLPASTAEEELIERHEQALQNVASPLTIEEAAMLMRCFGPDDCFGLAWTLVHLIESAPECPLSEPPTQDANEWVRRLWTRANGEDD